MRAARFIALAAFLGVLALSALMIYRPGTMLGTSGAALAHSLREEIGVGEVAASCDPERGEWSCAVGGSGAGLRRVDYSLETRDWGCWDADRTSGAGSGTPDAASGCVTILDYVRVL